MIRLDGEDVLLTHGDALCTDDHAYQELRSTVRDAAWQRRFLALPRVRRELLADEARAGSRAHTARTVPTIMDVNAAAVTRAFGAAGVRRMIHGHTHRPAVHELQIEGVAAQRIVLGAWHEQGSYLSLPAGPLPAARPAALKRAVQACGFAKAPRGPGPVPGAKDRRGALSLRQFCAGGGAPIIGGPPWPCGPCIIFARI